MQICIYTYLHSPDRLSITNDCFFFRARRLPSPVGNVIVMTIQIEARDKGNHFFTSRSLSLSLSHFFVYRDILRLYSLLQAWRPWPSSLFLLPFLSLVVIAFASYATASCLRVNTKVVTNIRKKSNIKTLHSYSLFFFLLLSLSLFLDLSLLYFLFFFVKKSK